MARAARTILVAAALAARRAAGAGAGAATVAAGTVWTSWLAPGVSGTTSATRRPVTRVVPAGAAGCVAR